MKKQRIIPISEKIEINTAAFEPSGNLPDISTVNQAVAVVTGKPMQVVVENTPPQYIVVSEPVTPKQIGRPRKEIADGRIKYNTMLQPTWIRKLRIRAAEQDITPADLLERILEDTNLLK
jgi:hypothetical protein